MSRTQFRVHGVNWFKRYAKKFKVKLGKFDRYLCHICHKGLKCLSKRKSGQFLCQNELKILAKYEQHKDLVEKQRAAYKRQIKNLKSNSAVVVFDYTTIHEATSFKVKVLDCAVIYKHNGKICRYFDYMAEARADFRFTIQSWVHLVRRLKFLIPNLTHIDTWSDGGLKTKEIIAYLLKIGFDNSISVNINYFAPYHGHNICDSHFGECKRRIRLTTGSGIVANPIQVSDAFNQSSNTEIKWWPRGHMDRVQLLPVHPFKAGIRRFFRFTSSYCGTNGLLVDCFHTSDSLSFRYFTYQIA